MSKFVTRAYNTLTVDEDNKSLIRKDSAEDRLRGEIEYYSNLPKSLQPFFPRMYDSSLKPGAYSMTLEYYAYSNLGEAMLGIRGEKSYDFWRKVFSFMGTFMQQCEKVYCDRGGTQKWFEDSRDMYIGKTEREHSALVENFPFFRELQSRGTIYLSGNDQRELKSFERVWPTVKKFIEENLCNELFSWIHGDCCFSNILYGEHPTNGDLVLKFIDPRGSFGKTNFYGDPYYDWAKLSHSCNGGYEYFINDYFSVNQLTSNEFVLRKDYDSTVTEIFFEEVEKLGLDKRKIRTLEATIFIGMCARHYDSLDRQKAMYLTGLKILNEIYEEILL